MPVVTPGTAFLFRGVAYLSVYVGSVYYGASQVAIYYGAEVSNWVLITGALAAAPVLSPITRAPRGVPPQPTFLRDVGV